MSDTIRVCAFADLSDGQCTLLDAKTAGWTDDIAVFRDGDRVYAINDTCTHEEASLSEGRLEDGVIECPQHQSRFDLQTGKVLAPPATVDTVAHLVDVRDGDVWLSPGTQPA